MLTPEDHPLWPGWTGKSVRIGLVLEQSHERSKPYVLARYTENLLDDLMMAEDRLLFVIGFAIEQDDVLRLQVTTIDDSGADTQTVSDAAWSKLDELILSNAKLTDGVVRLREVRHP